MMKRKIAFFFNNFKKADYLLLIAVLALSTIGLLVVKSATRTMIDGGIRIVMVQTFSIIIGIIFIFLFSKININSLKHFGIFIYLLTVGILIAVLQFGTGRQELGSQSWIELGFITVQPAEIAKLGFIVVASVFLERISNHKNIRNNVVKLLIYSSSIVVLVLLEKDYGTVVVFLFVFFVLVFIAGIKWKYVIMSLSLFIASIPAAWFLLLNETRKNRIRVFLNPNLDPLDAGFNVIQSKLAIGSGRLLGQGLYQGKQTSISIVPVNESDFIFSVIGEELGFIGAFIIVLLFVFILFRLSNIAIKSKDKFSKYVVMGICAMYTAHYIENVSMTMGLLPVTGIPLPFISAGGTFMLTNYLAIAIVFSVSIQNNRSIS